MNIIDVKLHSKIDFILTLSNPLKFRILLKDYFLKFH